MLLSLLFSIPALLIAITVHEAAHAWMASRLGDHTARDEGRVSLNPFAHLDPFGTLMILFAGFGWGKPVPYDPRYLKHPKRDEVAIALAGPGANLLTALILAVPYKIFIMMPIVTQSTLGSIGIDLIKTTIILNIVLLVFNLIPIPPLDGSKLLHPFLSAKNEHLYHKLAFYGPILLFGVIAFEHVFGIPIFSAILSPLVDAVWSFVLLIS